MTKANRSPGRWRWLETGGYRADWIDEYLLALGVKPVIPSKSNEDREHVQ